jgi:nicotinate-nucleotide adenylyltransferase
VRTGILGGTFDPIHFGHLAAARAAIDCAGLDRVLFVPTGVPPHRPPAVADAKDRLEMSRLATHEDPRFEVSDLELRREGASYTVDTLRELQRLHPDDELFLILGWDAAKLLDSWREPDEVRRLARIVIVTRPGSGAPAVGAEILCERPTPDIAASRLRRALKRGERVARYVPEPVAEYIAKHGLYRDNRQIGC